MWLPVLTAALLAVGAPAQEASRATRSAPAAELDEEPGKPKLAPPRARTERSRELPRAPAPTLPSAPAPAQLSRDKGPAPWIALGLSAALAVAGGIFATRTVDALNREIPGLSAGGLGNAARTPSLPATPDPAAIRQQQEDVFTNGLATTVCFSGAVAGLVSSAVVLLSD